jgi:GNAT superfamily N-acetyltransferase
MAVDDQRRLHRHPVQVAAWRGDDRTVVLSPSPDRPLPTVDDVALSLRHLADRGHHRAITSALHEHEHEPVLENGFTVHERLHLLRHDLQVLPAARPAPLRRAWRRDRPAVLALDALAFDDFWALDAKGLDDAIRATPVSRFRLHRHGHGDGPGGVHGDRAGGRHRGGGDPDVDAYAVTGRAGGRGYLQRLAVHPEHQRRGLGTALVADALGWLRRGGASQALVNTQERNSGALALYLACGFELEPAGLTVLARPLTDLRSGP